MGNNGVFLEKNNRDFCCFWILALLEEEEMDTDQTKSDTNNNQEYDWKRHFFLCYNHSGKIQQWLDV